MVGVNEKALIGMVEDIYQAPDSRPERPVAATASPVKAVVYGVSIAIGGNLAGAWLGKRSYAAAAAAA